MNTIKLLHRAKKAKNDEFYTRLEDIEKELQHYTQHFNDKIVLCNCNDARYGNFKNYFTTHFKELNLKKLICTAYGDNAFYTSFDGEMENRYELTCNGDFRDDEMIELLKKADIVCTNPPFSLFREYVAQLMAFDKKFLIIGNMNAITYKEVFPLIKENRMWTGFRRYGGDMYFLVNDDFEYACTYKAKREIDNQKVNRLFSICWFTNIGEQKQNKPIELKKKYNPEEYPKYDNCDAINVDKVADIPMDYNGAMGVPITFLDKYCPNQFEIIKFRNGDDDKDLCVNGKCPYFRILIKKKPMHEF